MDEAFVGYLVSVECKNTFYQGVIDKLDVVNNVLRLKSCFQNGMSCGTKIVEIKNDEIDNIEIIADALNAQKYIHASTTGIEKSLSSSSTNSTNSTTTNGITAQTTSQSQSLSSTLNGQKKSKSSPTSTSQRQKLTNGSSSTTSSSYDAQQNDVCFNQSSNEDSLSGDFDFEKNLALFDKQAFYQEMTQSQPLPSSSSTIKSNASSHNLANANDTSSASSQKMIYQPLSIENLFSFHSNLNKQHQNGTAVQSQSQAAPKWSSQKNYRCDEMILDTGEPVVLAQIQVPCVSLKRYVTDDGLIVPSISAELKARLFDESFKEGFSKQRQVECMGKCCCEMALQLLGGPIRFHPKNNHQKPRVLVLANGDMQGAYALCLARLLSNRNVFVFVFCNESERSVEVDAEMKLLKLTDAKMISGVEEIQHEPIDLIVNGLDSVRNVSVSGQLWFRNLVKFVGACKASVMSIDPPMEGGAIQAKWSIVPVLPQAMSPNCGRVYLCDLGFTRKLFESVGIKYQSPFGAKFLIPLHND